MKYADYVKAMLSHNIHTEKLYSPYLPAAFCMFRPMLLLPVIAFSLLVVKVDVIITLGRKIVNMKK